MNIRRHIIPAVWLAAALGSTGCGSSRDRAEFHTVTQEAVQVWSSYEGYLESRTVRNILPKIAGIATVIEIAPDGATVAPGDLLVRFDAAQLDRELLRLEKEYALAALELHSLTNAKNPLELRELEMRGLKSKADWLEESRFLNDSRALLAEGLVAEAEIRKQEEKVEGLRLQKVNLEQQLQMTRDFLHPSAVDRAVSSVNAASQELAMARGLLSNCTIYAEGPGVVLYKPVTVGGEYRTVRIGDSVFKNQPFMALPDMSNLVVHLDVPEAELASVQPGQSVVILPRAFPELRLQGEVESVGSMATTRPDRPTWQKFFHVVVALRETRPELRSGMSVLCRVLVVDEPKAVSVPRRAVRWDDNVAWCRMADGSRRPLTLGLGNERVFIVRAGVQSGDRIQLP